MSSNDSYVDIAISGCTGCASITASDSYFNYDDLLDTIQIADFKGTQSNIENSINDEFGNE